MTTRTIALALLVGCLSFALRSHLAHAAPFYDAAGLERLCRSNNGTFLPPTIDLPAYGCLASSGGSVICGGKGKYAKTCSVGRWKMKTIRKRNRGRG